MGYITRVRIEAEQLITFAVVAETGNLSEAASRLFKSQPAVSAQLKRLQEAVGEPLYTRHRYGVTLTKTGESLLPFAASLSRSLDGARQYAGELRGGHGGSLRIAASTTVAIYYLPRRLKAFADAHPATELHLLTSNTAEALRLLRRGSADLAMIEGPDDEVDLTHTVVAQDEVILAVLLGHPLAGRTTVSPKDLHNLAVVRRESGSGTRAVVDSALAHYNVRTKTILEAKGVDAVKEAVLQGFGAGFVSRLAVAREAEMGLVKVLPINAKGFKRPLSVVHPGLELCSQTTRAFIAFLTA